MKKLPITNVYIDGFNLYYGCLKGTPYRWLDVAKLCQFLLPQNHINQIKYFTARVSARPNDPQQPIRQETYLRALSTLPNVSIIYGEFLSHKVRMHLANPPATGSSTVEVIKTEEKGSDVNIATHLLIDGFLKRYEVAVIVSNDSDLYSPIEAVRNQLNLPVGMLNPYKKPSQKLKPIMTFYKPIREGVLRASQFPDTLSDENGTFSKPKSW